MLHFNCPHCAGVFQVDASQAGQEVACPLCNGVVTIGSEQPPQPASTTAEPRSTQELGCPLCNGVFQVTADMAGQQVACPHCAAPVTVPGNTQETRPAPGDDSTATQPPDSATGRASEQHSATPAATPGEAVPADEKLDEIQAHEGPRKVVVGNRVVEIRRLTPEERARRRLVRSLVMVVIGSAILFGTLVYLVKFRGLPDAPPATPTQVETPPPES